MVGGDEGDGRAGEEAGEEGGEEPGVGGGQRVQRVDYEQGFWVVQVSFSVDQMGGP